MSTAARPARDEDLQLLDIPAVRALTGLSERFVRELVYTRRVPVVKLGRSVFVRRADLAEWIQQNTTPPRER